MQVQITYNECWHNSLAFILSHCCLSSIRLRFIYIDAKGSNKLYHSFLYTFFLVKIKLTWMSSNSSSSMYKSGMEKDEMHQLCLHFQPKQCFLVTRRLNIKRHWTQRKKEKEGIKYQHHKSLITDLWKNPMLEWYGKSRS